MPIHSPHNLCPHFGPQSLRMSLGWMDSTSSKTLWRLDKDSCYQYGIMGLVSEDLNSLLAQLHVFQNTLHGSNLHKPRLAHLQNGMYLGAVFSELSRLRVEKKKKTNINLQCKVRESPAVRAGLLVLVGLTREPKFSRISATPFPPPNFRRTDWKKDVAFSERNS